MAKDYGPYGKGTEGYIHYMEAFERNGGGGGGGGRRRKSSGGGIWIAVLVILAVLYLLSKL